MPQEVVQCA